jgi:hypothetical protein
MESEPVAIRVMMDPALRAQFKAACAIEQKPMNEVVCELIKFWLQHQAPPGGEAK